MSVPTTIVLLGAMVVAGVIYGIAPLRSKAPAIAVGVLLLALLVTALIVAGMASPKATSGEPAAYAITMIGMAAAVLAGSPFVQSVLAVSSLEDAAESALPAGQWIGYVERLGYTGALLLGLTEVAAVLVGVKALGQYAAANQRSATNTVGAARVVGTLSSVIWATGCYAVVSISIG